MRVVTWNVNGRVRDAAARQLAAILERPPNVLALQEVTLSSYPTWCEGLMRAGFSVASTVDLIRLPYPEVDPPIRRMYFNLTAATHPLVMLPGLSFEDRERARFAFPEKYLAVRVALHGQAIEVHNAHLPPGSTRGIVKIEAFEAIRRRIDAAANRPRILCGDFNTPQAEDDATVTTWADAHPAFRERWDAAERDILEHPELRDTYRASRGGGERFPASHFTRGTARRYDHVFASAELLTTSKAVKYRRDWLDAGLSDHAAMEVELQPAAPDGSGIPLYD